MCGKGEERKEKHQSSKDVSLWCLCVCVCPIGDREVGVLPAYPSQPQSGQDYHFTDKVPLPYMVTGIQR